MPEAEVVQNRQFIHTLRPISLLPTIAKVFESSVGKWLLSFIEPYLDGNQFGCRKSRSTTHALIAILHTWMTATWLSSQCLCGLSESL